MLDDLLAQRLDLTEAIGHHLDTEADRRLCPTVDSRARMARRVQWLTAQLHACDVLIAAQARIEREWVA